MASNYQLRRFSNPATLKSIERSLLLRFLGEYRPFFAGRSLSLRDNESFDYDRLIQILLSPAEDTPEALMDALFFIDEMSVATLFDELSGEALRVGVKLDRGDDHTAGDLAVRIWLTDPDVLQRMHAERFLTKAKSFQSFLSAATKPPRSAKPSPEVLAALEDDLNNWFETKKRGRGTRVFSYDRDGYLWLLVRHGEPYKRESTLTDGESGAIFYRPEKFDVLIYNPELGELAIHAGTKGEKIAYCELVGRHLFGNRLFFDIEQRGGKYTLAPIRDSGRGCLVCSDVEGIEYILLGELQMRHDSAQYHIETHRATDVFQALEDIRRTPPDDAALVKASFRVKFTGAARPRTVVIRPPHVAIFDRESDSELVNDWLSRRGFIDLRRTGIAADADAALDVA